MTTDTKLAPTDAEIDALNEQFRWDTTEGRRDLARAALTRWGRPAHLGEPVAWMRDWDVYDPSNSGPEFSHTKKKKSKGWVPSYWVY